VTNGNMYLRQMDYQLRAWRSDCVSRTYNSISQSIGLFWPGMDDRL